MKKYSYLEAVVDIKVGILLELQVVTDMGLGFDTAMAILVTLVALAVLVILALVTFGSLGPVISIIEEEVG